MDEGTIQAYARLTAHEFALEVTLTTMLQLMPADVADNWLVEFRKKSRTFWVRDNIAADDISATKILRDAAEITEAFADKVAKRLASIRGQ